MRIAVFGTGGVGAYFGGRLAQAGEEVTFIARGEHLNAIQTSGLRVESVKGDFTVYPARATADPAQAGEMDVVLLGVKAWQVPQAGEAMRPMVGSGTFVVPLQNGVEAPGQLAAALGEEHVLAGMCRISALVAAPGLIRHVGIEPYVAFGELDNRPSPRAERLKSAFERAGVWAEVPADIQSALWQKFTFIASVSGVGAVTRAPTGLVRSHPGTRSMLEQAIQEIEAVARRRRVSLPGDILARTMATIDGMPEGVVPSMQRDIVEGRPSELEAQNGAVVRMGLEAGVPTPLHAFLYHSLYLQEKKARREAAF